jgi:signal transduction histidine kinase
MNLSMWSLKTRKIAASALHLIFLAIAVLGISTMYMNDNFGVGITRIKNVSYEETEEFASRFNSDINSIFQYIRYRDVFSRGGSISSDSELLRVMYGPTETVSYTLQDLIVFLEARGYILSEDFVCTKTGSSSAAAENREGYVIWTAASPEVTLDTPHKASRTNLEDAALKVMDSLSSYYRTYNRFFVSGSNFLFKISYTNPDNAADTTVYTNADGLTEDNVRSYGKYAYLPGNSVFYDTNLRSIALNTIPALVSYNPYSGSNFYLLAAVDTSYPADDIYAQAKARYTDMQDYYITGFVFMVIGILVAAMTLIYLIRISGHVDGSREIHLRAVDRNHTGTGLLLFALVTAAGLGLCRVVVIRLVHLSIPRDSWPPAEKACYLSVIYLGALLAFFSMLRRFKAGVLYSGSWLCVFEKRMQTPKTGKISRFRAFVQFAAFILVNAGLVGLSCLLFTRTFVSRALGLFLGAVVLIFWLVMNLWIFSGIFRHRAEMNELVDAVSRIASGETDFKMDTEGFDGQELALADGLNSIGDGLENALREKVRSERLKADLITNVSHDIKTPLTSIINYVDLIKRENITDPRVQGYLNILDQKSQRLKTLTEDLVEASKASSGNIHMEMTRIDLVELVCQTNGEFEDRLAARKLQLIMRAPEEPLIIFADGRSLWRVVENLYTNVCKYALEGSRVYVDIVRQKADTARQKADAASARAAGKPAGAEGMDSLPDRVVFTIKNISSRQLNIDPEELTERFVRGDVSRTTEGSGLGLSIAKSLTELMKGTFTITIDGDLFKASVAFDLAEPEKKEETPPAEDASAGSGAPQENPAADGRTPEAEDTAAGVPDRTGGNS